MSEKDPYLLDNDRYYLMGRAEAGGLPVILQCSSGQPVHYCVQYAGSGKYFDTLAEAMAYMHKRWGFDLDGKPRAILRDGQAMQTDEQQRGGGAVGTAEE